MQESTNSSMPSPSEQVDVQYALYLRDLVFHYIEHMLWYEEGSVGTEDFMPEMLDDVYNEHLYCMSWFYGGVLPFDSFKIEYENWLYERVFRAME